MGDSPKVGVVVSEGISEATEEAGPDHFVKVGELPNWVCNVCAQPITLGDQEIFFKGGTCGRCAPG